MFYDPSINMAVMRRTGMSEMKGKANVSWQYLHLLRCKSNPCTY